MTNDPMQALRSAGIQTDQLSGAEQQVLGKLSAEEVQTLASIRKKLAGNGDDTSGYALSLPQGTQLGSLSGVQTGTISLVPTGTSLSGARTGAGGSVSAIEVTGGLIF